MYIKELHTSRIPKWKEGYTQKVVSHKESTLRKTYA